MILDRFKDIKHIMFEQSIFDLVVENVVECCVPEMVHYCISIVYHVAKTLYCSYSLLPLESYLITLKSDF